MEIVTYVLHGALEHRDSMANGSILRAGELQRMTAGTGVRHSEFNNKLVAGDGLAISDENTVAVRAATDSEVLLFNLS
jgi:redox-sensitive bicupin YhaK (pirin superfamily)